MPSHVQRFFSQIISWLGMGLLLALAGCGGGGNGGGGAPPQPIGVSASTFTFSATTGGGNPVDQFLTITNSQPGTLNWTITDNAAWLILTPAFGTIPALNGTIVVTVSADITSLTPNTYTATITIANTAGTSPDQIVTVTITVNGIPPIVATPPFNVTVLVDQMATFSVVANGTATLTYQWQKNSVDIGGATAASYTTPATVIGDSGNTYRVVVSNGYGSATSASATLTVNPVAPAILSYGPAGSTPAGFIFSFCGAANGSSPLTLQWQLNGVDIPGQVGGLPPPYVPDPANNGLPYRLKATNPYGTAYSPDFYVVVTGSAPHIDTQPADQSGTLGSTVTFTFTGSASPTEYFQWQKNGVDIPGATASSYTTPPVVAGDDGAQYRAVWTNFWGSVTTNSAMLTVTNIPPAIIADPTPQTVMAGQTATFFVTATGSVPLSFQWQKDTVDIPGANSASYTTPTLTLADNGASYRVIVTNGAGNATSASATLTVNPVAPTITVDPSNQTATDGGTATFSVTATGSPTLTYQWQKNNIDIPGATLSSYTTPATSLADNGNTYRVIVTNAAGSVTSTAATLMVLTATLSVTGGPITLSVPERGPNPAVQNISVTNPGPIGSTLKFIATGDKSWLSLAPAYGSVAAGTGTVGVQLNVFQTEVWPGAISAVGAPSPRQGATAVWTGREMIVWGGDNDAGTSYNNGARYNPTSDTWTSMTNINAPAARTYHCAVWTGSHMIVWGGNGLNDGALYDPVSDTWTGVTTTLNAPTGRSGPCAAWTGTEMVVFGGNDGANQNTGGRYNPDTDTWFLGGLPTLNAPTPRRDARAIWTGTEVIVWGGWDGSSAIYQTGARYTPATNTWSPAPTELLYAASLRHSHGMVWDGDRMIVWGGFEGGSTSGWGMLYDPATDTWLQRTLEQNTPPGRGGLCAVWTGTEMIVWGGRDFFNTVVFGDGYRYRPPLNIRPGSYTGTVTVHDPLALNSPQTVTVNLTVTNALTPTINANPAALNFNIPEDAPNPVQVLQVGNTGTANSTLVWTAERTKVWFTADLFSGQNAAGSSTVMTVTAVKTRSDSWPTRQIKRLNFSQYRRAHTAVWDDVHNEMLVWGGVLWTSVSTKTVYSDGGIYNVADDRWRNLTATGAPTPRYGHCAVWTGSRMLVWGGIDGAGAVLGDGAVYNPTTNTWMGAMSATNAPSARAFPAAVWTGTDMVVWGGDDGTNALGDGYKYTAGTDTWNPVAIAATNAPAARTQHTAVWTGTEMIVWGGKDSTSTRLNTGGRYNPGTDTWNPAGVSTTGAPTARFAQAAIWTGSEMVVYGGYLNTGTSATNTGGRYDPTTDSWLGATPASQYQAYAPAMYTGFEGIFHGGTNTTLTSTTSVGSRGYRYLPAIHLAPGVYNDTLTITDPLASNSPKTVPVTFTIYANWRLSAMSPAPGSSTSSPAAITLTATHNLNAATVNTTNVTLIGSGGDGTFSDGNEVTIAPDSVGLNGTQQIEINLSSTTLTTDTYQVTVKAAVRDTGAVALDGEYSGTLPSGDGTPGGDFTATFIVP